MQWLLKIRSILTAVTDALLVGRNRGWWSQGNTPIPATYRNANPIQPLAKLPPAGINRTRLAWVLVVIALLAYEAYSLVNGVPGDTLSEAVWGVSHDYPLLPFAAGIVAGHFFWQRKSNVSQK